MFIVFVAIVLLVSGLIHGFLYRGLVRGLGIHAPTALWSLRALAVLLAVSYPLVRWLDGFAPHAIVVGAHWIASLWMGLMFHLFWIGVLLWLGKTALRLTGVWGRLSAHHELLGRGAVLGCVAAALVLGIVGMISAYAPARIRHARVPVAGFTPELGRLRIVLVADFHAGVLVGPAFVDRRVEEIQALRPDLVLVPGDILDHPPERIPEIARSYARLTAPLGIFASTGNHEYIVGLERSLAFLERAGMEVLSNERVKLDNGLVVAGVEDAMARRLGLTIPPASEILGPTAKDEPVIYLCHTPGTDDVREAIAAGADLVVSGHTHGGQVWPFGYVTRSAFPFFHGLYEVDGGRQLTTCGIGFWGPPMRLGAPPELWVIELAPETAPVE